MESTEKNKKLTTTMINQASESITQNHAVFTGSGKEIMDNILVGVESQKPDVTTKIKEVNNLVLETMSNYDWKSVGGEIINGIVIGMGQMIDSSRDRVRTMVSEFNSFVSGQMSELDIPNFDYMSPGGLSPIGKKYSGLDLK